MSTQDSSPLPGVPHIRQLTIRRFRGIPHLEWKPAAGLNVLIGGHDVGKSTVLDAIALLLAPSNAITINDWDYWMRESDKGFRIEAVMSLPSAVGIYTQSRPAYPWRWVDDKVQQPALDDDAAPEGEPVFILRVRGTSELDVTHELWTPSEQPEHLGVGLRRGIGLVRLGGEERTERDLRLVYGSALDRLLGDKTLRSRLGRHLANETDVHGELQAEGKKEIAELGQVFTQSALPGELHLGFTGAQGISLGSLIGLVAQKPGSEVIPPADAESGPATVAAAPAPPPSDSPEASEEDQPEVSEPVWLPMASWGAGTRRLAALTLAGAKQGNSAVIVVDEVERALEPHRQRTLVTKLKEGPSQAFMTTHSPVALQAAGDSAVWYMESPRNLGRIPDEVTGLRNREPEALLSRLTIVAEGETEIGFLKYVLGRALGDAPMRYGIWLADGRGNDQTLGLLLAFGSSGLRFGGFADNEGRSPERWARVKARAGPLVFQWDQGCLESNLIKLVPVGRLEEFIATPEGVSGERRRTLQERAETPDKEFETLTAAGDIYLLIEQAATGHVPDHMRNALEFKERAASWRSHGKVWFKTEAGGRELAEKMFRFGLWPSLEQPLMPFVNAVRSAVGLAPLQTVPPP